MSADGRRPAGSADKPLGEIVQEVSQKASLLVRQEIALAKVEVAEKAKKLGTGAAAGAAAGFFVLLAVIFLFTTLAWLLADLYGDDLSSSIWLGFLTVFVLLVVLAAVAGLLAKRFIERGSPPTPDMAIEQAKLTRAQLEAQRVGRDQLERGLERGEELTS